MKFIITLMVAAAFAITAAAHCGSCDAKGKDKHKCTEACKDGCKGKKCAEGCTKACCKKDGEKK